MRWVRRVGVVVWAGMIAALVVAPGASAQVLPLPPIVQPPEDPPPQPPPGDEQPAPPPPPTTTPGVVGPAPGTVAAGANPARTGHFSDDALVPPLVKRWEIAAEPISMVAADGRVFLGFDRHVTAVDQTTGRELWSAPARGLGLSYDAGRLFMPTEDGLTALDASTGAQLWRVELASTPDRAVAAGGAVYYTIHEAHLRAVNAADGAALWSVQVSKGLDAAVDDSRVYLLYGCGSGVALNRRDGSEAWKRSGVSCDEPHATRAALANGRLYDSSGFVLDPATGQELARNAGGGTIFFDGRVVAGAPLRGQLAGFDAGSWKEIWRHKIMASATLAVGHDVYAIETNGPLGARKLRAFDGETGVALWHERLPGDLRTIVRSGYIGHLAAAPGVLIASANGRVTAWESYFKPAAGAIALGYDRTEFPAGGPAFMAGVLGVDLRAARPKVTLERAGWRRGSFRPLVRFPVALDGGFGTSAKLTRNARLRVSAGGARSNVINVYAWPVVRLGKARAAGRTRITVGATVRSPGAPLAGRSFSIYLDRRGAKRLTRIATGRLRAAGRGGRFRSTLTFTPLRRVKRTDAILFCVRGQLDLDLGRPSNLLRQCGAGSVRRG